MHRFLKLSAFTGAIGLLVVFYSFYLIKRPIRSNLRINIIHLVGNRELKLDSVTYHNGLNQAYTVSKFKYYLSNFELINSNHQAIPLGEYFLIDEEDPASKKIAIKNLPSGVYTGISFLIGVDSLHNCSGAQSGALDPINGMFWAWHTGYIFFKLEGKSTASKQAGGNFEWHIGGYQEPVNCIRKVNLNFKQKKSSSLDIDLDLVADINNLFTNPKVIDLANFSSVTGVEKATTIADQYSQLFYLR